MPSIEDKLIAKGGVLISGAGEALGKVLTSDASGNATWQAPGAGAGYAMTKIGDFTLVGGTTLRYAAIPQTFAHLHVELLGQSNRAGQVQTGMRMTLNGVGTGYHLSYYGVETNAFLSGGQTNQAWGFLGSAPAGSRGSDANVSVHRIDVPFYTVAAAYKQFFAQANYLSGGVNGHATLTVGNEAQNVSAAVTQIDITDDVGGALGPMARATLYGIS